MLSLFRQPTGAAFLQVAEEILQRDEVANNLIYGIALRLVAEPERFDLSPYLATVHDDHAMICAALMTPPHRLVLFAQPAATPAAFHLLIDDLWGDGWQVPGVNAPKPLAQTFAAAWQAMTGQHAQVDGELRVFELRSVRWPPMPTGYIRRALPEDEPLVWQWYCDFISEAVPNDPMPSRPNVRRSLTQGNIFLWDDGGPVCLVARGRALPHGYSVGPVYTPPALRGRGYAAACTAAASQALLDAGAQFCTLFTDLANPISNKIYQRIGYRPVCDYTEYTFESTPA